MARTRAALEEIYSVLDTLDGVPPVLVVEALFQALTSTLIALEMAEDSDAAGAMLTMALEQHKSALEVALEPSVYMLVSNIEIHA